LETDLGAVFVPSLELLPSAALLLPAARGHSPNRLRLCFGRASGQNLTDKAHRGAALGHALSLSLFLSLASFPAFHEDARADLASAL